METGSRLTVRAYHVTDVAYGTENRVTVDGHLTVCKETAGEILKAEPLIKSIDIRIIAPDEHQQHTNTIMDVIPLSTKVLGKVGEGITHTLAGGYVLLTGIDESGRQCATSEPVMESWQRRWPGEGPGHHLRVIC